MGDFGVAITESVAAYVRDSIAGNTRRAYQSDLAHFEGWGGSIPSSDREVASYIAEYAVTLSTATLSRRIASISKAHSTRGVPSPTTSELVKATLRGIKRIRGTAQTQAKPLMREDLFDVLAAMGHDLKAVRDRALLLIGFAGGFRRSELVGLNHGDIEQVRQGVVIHLRRSKTDQEGAGRKIGIPHGRARWCPVMALDDWFAQSGIEAGPLFRGVNRHGQLMEHRLSGEAVSVIVKERVAAAGLNPAGYSGHSLRAGFATSAAQAGASSWKIRAQTGHTSDLSLSRYLRDGSLFVGNAAGALL